MPITIKEIISSDSMSGVIEKVNFNFDQLILAGGGPPGIQGIQGEIGPVGPQGFRGDHWFAGPSAFGQTADHDGSSLRIRDHFLDSVGDVYEFYNVGGATGWTSSGINLKGPQGIPGTAGGSLEWKYYLAATGGNPIDGQGYSPTPTVGFTNNEIDFLIPNETFKNSIFLGNQNWAYFNLKNFGTNVSGIRDTSSVPKFTIIQNNINPNGQNGISFGGPLPEGGTSGGPIYGNSGSTSSGGPTYSAFNFVHAAFATEQAESGGTFITKWKVHSYQSNIKIQAGGATSGAAPYIVKPATIEVMSADVKISNYDRTKSINIERDFFFNNGTGGSSDILKEIQINSIPYLDVLPGVSGATNTYGYVALQNQQGAGTIYTAGYPEHRSGSVIIGPTYNTAQGIPIATNNFQGLGIVRKITRFNTVDSAIKFFQDSVQIGNSNLKNAKFLTLAGSITPVRTTEDAANVSGNSGVVLDSLMINAGSYDITNSTVSTTGVTAYNGGRLGISNNTRTINKPQFPIHISAIPDVATRKFMWDGDSVTPGDRVTNWYVGFDSRETESSRNGGIAFGNTIWKDDQGFTTYEPIPGGGKSGIQIPIFNPAPISLTNPLLKTYVRRDSSATTSYYGSTFGLLDEGGGKLDFSASVLYGQVQGYENPHIYIQPGKEDVTGNVGIGFVPGSTAYNELGSIDLRQISYAKSKLAINGSITIGSTHSGYHKLLNSVPVNGALIGGLIVQGETKTQGLNTLRWRGPVSSESSSLYLNFTGIDDTNYRLAIGFATEKTIMAKRFIAKGDASPMYPDFALPDAKTGMGRMIGELGVGALYADRGLNAVPSSNTGATTVSQTVTPIVVAKWSSAGDGLSKNDSSRSRIGGFTVTDAFALEPAYYNINTIPWYAANYLLDAAPSYAHQIIYHEIPSKNSTAFIDLSMPMNPFPHYTTSSIGGYNSFYQPTAGGGAYLSGRIPSNGGQQSVRPNSHQFTIENGYYDGQILRLMFLDVNGYNESVLVPNRLPKSSANPASVVPASSLSFIDNIVLAAEKYSSANSTSIAGWPLSNVSTSGGFNQFFYRPWPQPLNSPFPITTITPAMGTVNSANVDTAIINAINQYNTQNNVYWTNNATLSYDPYSVPYNGSFADVYGTPGLGAFRITPWRSITLQWKFDNNDNDTTTYGAWYEIARENLVPRKMRIYSGSGLEEDSLGYNVGLGGDALISAPFKYPTVPVSYSFYNPTGEATMQILSNGSAVKNIQMTESGQITNQTPNFKVTVQAPYTYLGTNNKVELKCKITEYNSANRYSGTVIRNLTVLSTTGATSIDTGATISPSVNSTYAIECSAIIEKQST